ncbi:unnamed protein product [Rotaria magnacalcarata]|uniref:Uncharacterized protein n=1 Tax=Rotaria magnacalcarata TaxID=392030 RepID=A0A820ECH2_9BILA|nr:unnamed protein product [Rotaria magnacalcarata]CAF4379676.1 unnamed protein product [Rotaria magnacalcarata]
MDNNSMLPLPGEFLPIHSHDDNETEVLNCEIVCKYVSGDGRIVSVRGYDILAVNNSMSIASFYVTHTNVVTVADFQHLNIVLNRRF